MKMYLKPKRINSASFEIPDLQLLREFCDIEESDASYDTRLESIYRSVFNFLNGYSGYLGRSILIEDWLQEFTMYDADGIIKRDLVLWASDVEVLRIEKLDRNNQWIEINPEEYEILENVIGAIVRLKKTPVDIHTQKEVVFRAYFKSGMTDNIHDVPASLMLGIKSMVRQIFFAPETTPKQNEVPWHIQFLIDQYRVVY